MKSTAKKTLKKALLFAFLIVQTALLSQINKSKQLGKIDQFYLPYEFSKDSSEGFDVESAWLNARQAYDALWIQKRIIARQKRDFIDIKYGYKKPIAGFINPNGKFISSSNSVMAACTNVDFELGNINGWTLTEGPNNGSNTMAGCCPAASAMFAVVGPGVDPNTGIPTVPPGSGNFTCRFGNMTLGGTSYRLKQTFTVSAANAVFTFKYAVILEDGAHICNEQPFFNVTLNDCNNNPIPCSSFNVVAGSGCQGFTNFLTSGGYKYKNWQTNAFDLTSYIGTCVTIEFTVGGCVSWQGAHAGYAYVDASCLPMNLTLNNNIIPTGQTTSTVCSSGTNVLCAPLGFNYLWTGPGVTGNTSQCVNVITPGSYSVALSQTGQNCFAPVLTSNFVLTPSPIANFSIAYTPCATSLTAISTSSLNGGPSISNFQYVWNDATPNSTLNPATHTYAGSGAHQIKLVVTNSAGCADSIVKNITITQKPTANFTVNSSCSGALINFTNTSTTPSGTFNSFWDFGDASSSNIFGPSHNYSNSGNFLATLIITNTDNCIDSIKKTVNVYGRAVVNFAPNAVCFGTVTNFTNTTNLNANPNTGGISSYNWNFGNGATSVLQNPIYTYTAPSNATINTNYSVSLVATTVNGCKDSISKLITVYSLPSPNFVSDSVCFGNATTLTNTSNNNGNPFSSFSWDFNADNIADLTNNNLSVTNTFLSWGNNSVTYTVYTTPNNSQLICSNTITKNVWVNPSPAAVITHTNKCIDSQPILMSGVNSTLAVGTITNYAWNYGNNNFNLINPTAASSYSYNLSGNYLVTLTVTSSKGCRSNSSQLIEVWEKPYANFSYSKACAGKQITLKGNQLPISAPISSYQWDFNNTINSIEGNGAVVSYTFTNGGFQPINVLITSDKGCKNTVAGSVYINYNPSPKFFAPKRAGCTDLCIPILDSTQAIPGPAKNITWEWDYGNQLTGVTYQSNTQHVCYSNPSNLMIKDFSLKLIVRTDSGCVDSISKPNYIKVYPKPKADFEWVGKDGDLLTPLIEFQNTSVGYNSFYWYYNDGVNITDSSNQHPTHYYNTDIPRNFNVFLAVKNQYGCRDTISKYVDIGPMYTFYIPNTFTPNDDGINETFTGTGIGIKAYKMWIYDRWGEKLYYTEDINKGWDASVKGVRNVEKMDVYTYKAVVTDLWNKDHEYVGHVTLLK